MLDFIQGKPFISLILKEFQLDEEFYVDIF